MNQRVKAHLETHLERGRFLREWGAAMIGLSCIVIATIAIIALARTEDLDRRLTPVEGAPCRLQPEGKECNKMVNAIIKAMTPQQAHELKVKADQYAK